MRIDLELIRATTRRIPYGESEKSLILLFLQKEARNKLVVGYHPRMGSTKQAWHHSLQDGVLILTCPQLAQDLVFVRKNNGRGLLGGQKSLFRVHLGDASIDDFLPGPAFKNFGLSLFSINNIFRGQGFLKGGAY